MVQRGYPLVRWIGQGGGFLHIGFWFDKFRLSTPKMCQIFTEYHYAWPFSRDCSNSENLTNQKSPWFDKFCSITLIICQIFTAYHYAWPFSRDCSNSENLTNQKSPWFDKFRLSTPKICQIYSLFPCLKISSNVFSQTFPAEVACPCAWTGLYIRLPARSIYRW